MTTNFFELIAGMQIAADWKIHISRSEENQLTVSVLLCNDKGEEAARKIVPPMLFKGTAQELGEGFFAALEQPAKATDALFANMEQYLQQVEAAKKQSKMEQDKGNKENKEKEERRKKYETMMKRVDELEEAKKYQEAIANLPKEKDFPEQAEEIKKRLEALRQKNGQLTLM
jgi:PRTRC genetic system protein E